MFSLITICGFTCTTGVRCVSCLRLYQPDGELVRFYSLSVAQRCEERQYESCVPHI